MIEIGQYRVSFPLPSYSEFQGEAYVAASAVAEQKSLVYLQAQAVAYKQTDDCHCRYKEKNAPALFSVKNDKGHGCFIITADVGFRNFLSAQPANDAIKAIEAPSAAQYMVFADFIPQTYNRPAFNASVSQNEFNNVSRGIVSGKAITEAEKEARIAMSDAVFNLLSERYTKIKSNTPNLIVEIEEKNLGCFFVRVSTQENKEYGVSYGVRSTLEYLDKDPNVGGVLPGPELYPTDIEKLRNPPVSSSTPPVRQPKTLNL